jgi:hypothetical protein
MEQPRKDIDTRFFSEEQQKAFDEMWDWERVTHQVFPEDCVWKEELERRRKHWEALMRDSNQKPISKPVAPICHRLLGEPPPPWLKMEPTG